MVRPTKLLLPLALTLLLSAAFVPPAGAEMTVSFGVFFDGLAPYGAWTDHPRLGMVWSPDVAPGWRPYSDGRWAFAADEGWTWLGDEPWAWAPYHYGNWMFDPVAGWLWVPGYDEWAPAVVDWRVTDDWIGWAPRPLSASWIVGPRLLPVHYTFVERRYFGEPLLTRYIVPIDRNVALFSLARPVRVVDVDWIEAAGPRIQRVRLRDVTTPRELRAGWKGSEVPFFRPQIRGGLGPPAGRRLAKIERLQGRGRRALVEPSKGRGKSELRAASRGRDRVVVAPGESGRPRAKVAKAGRRIDRGPKVERSTPRRVREIRADRPGRSRDVLERRSRGRAESRVGARDVERRPAVKRSPQRNAREQRATGRTRGGGGGGQKIDRGPQRQRQHGAQRGGGKKGGGKPPG